MRSSSPDLVLTRRSLPQYGASHELGARKSRNANIQRVVDGVQPNSRPGTGPPGMPLRPPPPVRPAHDFPRSSWDTEAGQRPTTIPTYDTRPAYAVTTGSAPAPLSKPRVPRASTTGGAPGLSIPTGPRRSNVPMPSMAAQPPPPPPPPDAPLNY